MIYAKNILLFFLLGLVVTKAATIEIKGKVRDANTYSVIPGVNIYIAGSSTGATSIKDGSFILEIANPDNDMTVIFEHVAFDTLQVGLLDALEMDDFYLEQRIIEFPMITVEGQRETPDIARDIPQSLAIVEAKRFEVQGYTDAGDLLKTEQSIQIDENLSGEKNISIRAGNSEDVIIMFNGIKMNDIYDNRFDISLINLEDIRQIQIIKGSNTALYGSEAFSGVVNFIPKTYRNYLVRFMQRFGTYNSGDYNLQLNHYFFDRLNISYNLKQGANKRRYTDDPEGQFHLQNSLTYHTGNIVYDFSGDPEEQDPDQLSASFIYSQSDFNDLRYDESMDNLNRIFSLRYDGDIGPLPDFDIVASRQLLDKNDHLDISGSFHDRRFLNHRDYFNFGKAIELNPVSVHMAYQFEDAQLDYSDIRNTSAPANGGIESGNFNQQRHGFVSILKLHSPTGSEYLQVADFDISGRYDKVTNRGKDLNFRNPDEADPEIANNDWDQTTVKFSAHVSGNHTISKFTTFLNYGTNIKFPTLFQQLSTPAIADPTTPGVNTNLNPEKNRSLELGVEFLREPDDLGNMDGWQVSATYFKNYYENKIRTYQVPGVPVSFYDNVPTADISGFEATVKGYFLRKKFAVELGYSDYNISDMAAFPFKYDHKIIANLFIDHAGYSMQIHWFKEGEQIGLILDRSGTFTGLPLPAYQNVDVHLGKTFELPYFKLFFNFSGRNLIDEAIDLQGIAIRDRRFYISMGIEY